MAKEQSINVSSHVKTTQLIHLILMCVWGCFRQPVFQNIPSPFIFSPDPSINQLAEAKQSYFQPRLQLNFGLPDMMLKQIQAT